VVQSGKGSAVRSRITKGQRTNGILPPIVYRLNQLNSTSIYEGVIYFIIRKMSVVLFSGKFKVAVPNNQ
jgi:hypothetical protein